LDAASATGRPFAVGFPAGEPPGGFDLLTNGLTAELSRLGADQPKTRIGVLVVDPRSGLGLEGEDEVTLAHALFEAPSGPPHVEWFALDEPERITCLVVGIVEDPRDPDAIPPEWRPLGRDGFTNILGPCGFYARYGRPGIGVTRWLEAKGSGFALLRSRPDGSDRREIQPTPRGLFGMRKLDFRNFNVDTRVEACLNGDEDLCERLAVDPSVELRLFGALSLRRPGIPLLGSTRMASFAFGPIGPEMLDRVEREFGSEAFERFWVSDRPVGEAFSDAFGTPLGTWIRRWAGEAYAPPRATGGTDLSLGDALYALVWVGMAMGAVLLRSKKRQLL
jgi:hypothetical protein